jgi:transposase InsO family protein
VREELRRVYGKRVSRKKVARLLRENRLNARRKHRWVRTTTSVHSFPVCDNLLNREFHADRGGQKWVSDSTYLRTRDGFMYLTIVLDLYDRNVVGWAFSDNLDVTHTSIAALSMAVNNRPPEHGLLFHSDRGVQYCASALRAALRRWCPGVRQSMSRKGNCWDNACAESFFKTLKTELATLDGKASPAEVRQSVFMYIEAYYNRVRLHSTLDYVAPDMLDYYKVA